MRCDSDSGRTNIGLFSSQSGHCDQHLTVCYLGVFLYFQYEELSDRRIGLKTLKNPEELHGIGMRSIQYVVGKYHGILKWECRENLFITDITMYL